MNRMATLCALVLTLCCAALAAGETIAVDGGIISGVTEDGVRVFKGIPFAAPASGDFRWRPPQPVVAWEGVRPCDTFGPECPQPPVPQGFTLLSAP